MQNSPFDPFNPPPGVIIGALPPPPGVIPNFANPDSTSWKVVLVGSLCICLATFFMSLRIYTRAAIIRFLGADDYFLILGWVFATAMAVCGMNQTRFGLGKHGWDIPLNVFAPRFLQIAFVQPLLYFPAILCLKISILLFYLRISPNPIFRSALYALIGATVLYSTGSFFLGIFLCRPIRKAWDIRVEGGDCISDRVFFLAPGVVNLATDLGMIILPIPMLWSVRLPIKQKIGLVAIFMSGSFVCVVGALRLNLALPNQKPQDGTWENVGLACWSIVEPNFAVICACLPIMKPFLRAHFPRVIGSSAISSRPSRLSGWATLHLSSNNGNGGVGGTLSTSRTTVKSAALGSTRSRVSECWSPNTAGTGSRSERHGSEGDDLVELVAPKLAEPPRGGIVRVHEVRVESQRRAGDMV